MSNRTRTEVENILSTKKEGKDSKKFLYQLNILQRDAYMSYCLDWFDKNLMKELDSIERLNRNTPDKCYNNWNSHCNSDSFMSTSNRGEELFVLKLFDEYKRKCEKTHPIFGELLDYQVPLKKGKNDSGYGKIDFVSVDRDKKELYINEIKADYNGECIIRPIIEIESYYRMFNHETLLKDFNCEDYKIVKRIIIYENTMAHREYIGKLATSCHDKLLELIKKLEVDVIVIRENVSIEKVN